MNVNDQALFIGGRGQLGKARRIEQQVSRPARIPVRLGQRCGLRRKFQHAVGEHLDPRKSQIRYAGKLLP